MKEMSRPFHTFRREHSLRLHPAIFFTHDIFHFDATAVKRTRGCVADFILVIVYGTMFLTVRLNFTLLNEMLYTVETSK